MLHIMTDWAVGHGLSFETIEVARPSLEDVYLELTGEQDGAK
jgi:hypothetical protein